jgi:hypothetical protein
MAKSVDDAGPPKGHNLNELKKIIREVATVDLDLKARIKKLRAEGSEARARLKEHGIKIADYRAALRYYELEGDDRDEALDGLRLAFLALKIGVQADLFPEEQPAE